MLYITSLVLTYLITGRLYFLTAFIQFPLPTPLVTANLISFSVRLFVCFRSKNDLQNDVNSYYAA